MLFLPNLFLCMLWTLFLYYGGIVDAPSGVGWDHGRDSFRRLLWILCEMYLSKGEDFDLGHLKHHAGRNSWRRRTCIVDIIPVIQDITFDYLHSNFQFCSRPRPIVDPTWDTIIIISTYKLSHSNLFKNRPFSIKMLLIFLDCSLVS